MLAVAEEIFGPFDSKEETVKTADILELEGCSNATITVFTHGAYADNLHDQTDVSVVSLSHTEKQDTSLLDKIKQFIFNPINETSDLYSQLLERGLSEGQAREYSEQIKSGKMIITVENELKMGNDPAKDMTSMKESVEHIYQ
ncbi:hypothetical protein EU245_13110 [Lentibacillus lipolyticus]|nr:hypothetical protein EU245_13110 [Lentibacillus lipolyticus]